MVKTLLAAYRQAATAILCGLLAGLAVGTCADAYPDTYQSAQGGNTNYGPYSGYNYINHSGVTNTGGGLVYSYTNAYTAQGANVPTGYMEAQSYLYIRSGLCNKTDIHENTGATNSLFIETGSFNCGAQDYRGGGRTAAYRASGGDYKWFDTLTSAYVYFSG